jgi:hypothetical protein
MIAAGTLDQGGVVFTLTAGNGASFPSLSLRDWFTGWYPSVTGAVKVRFVLSGTARMHGTTSGGPISTGTWPVGSFLYLDMPGGLITGLGGTGGVGGDGSSSGPFSGAPGGAGSAGLVVTYPISINNTGGIISGGAGGGGGGGGARTGGLGGSGGGGGGGSVLGLADIGGPSDGTTAGGGIGSNAGISPQVGGGGGYGGYGPSLQGGTGGAGGDLGQPGEVGAAGTGTASAAGGAGGAVGPAVIGNSLVTWITVGDVRGPLVP